MKREPVIIYSAVLAGLGAFLAIGGLTDRVPEDVVFWLGAALAVMTAVGGVVVRGQTTPLSDPQARDGRPLVPSPPAEVPPGTPQRELDATQEETPVDTGQPLPGLHRAQKRPYP